MCKELPCFVVYLYNIGDYAVKYLVLVLYMVFVSHHLLATCSYCGLLYFNIVVLERVLYYRSFLDY